MEIKTDRLEGDKIALLLDEHLADMFATSPPESAHALDLQALKHSSITFWCAWEKNELLGCAAIKELNLKHGEIKSMRTTEAARNKGVASALLTHLLEVARSRGYNRLSLETGSQAFFRPARRLYENHGFGYCDPFADYKPDPNSCFMTRELDV